MDTMTSLRVFCAVAELKSFAAAGRRLNLSPAMVSKHVMHLERRIGVRLLNRTSRSVSPTESGALYFAQARQALEGLDEVEAALGDVTVSPRGTLRFSAPVWTAGDWFVGLLAAYNRRHPDVTLDIDLSGRLANLVDEALDLALRATRPERLDPGLVARPLWDVAFRLMGSPGYLGRSGRPATVRELDGHALLRYRGMPTGGEGPALEGPGGPHRPDFRTVMVSDNETVLRLAALQGMGLVFLPTWMVGADLEAGRLEVLLPDTVRFSVTMYAVYPSRRYLSAKVRTFIDFLASQAPEPAA